MRPKKFSEVLLLIIGLMFANVFYYVIEYRSDSVHDDMIDTAVGVFDFIGVFKIFLYYENPKPWANLIIYSLTYSSVIYFFHRPLTASFILGLTIGYIVMMIYSLGDFMDNFFNWKMRRKKYWWWEKEKDKD